MEHTWIEIDFSLPTSLVSRDDPAWFISTYVGDVRECIDESRKKIGSATAHVIRIGDAKSAGMDMFYVMDETQDVHDFYGLIGDDGWISEDATDGVAGDLLIIDRVTLNKTHRGRGLGRVVVAQTILAIGRGCDLAALQPSPIGDIEESQRSAATRRISSHWQGMGFTPVDDRILTLDLSLESTGERLWSIVDPQPGH